MNTHEWALIIFTIVMQMAVGSFVILGGVHFFATRNNGIEEADKMSDRALLVIGPMVVIGLLVTFLHLGNPVNAPRAISNLGSSWLSREILLSVLFCGGGAVFAFLQWRKISTAQIRNIIALVVAVIGVVLVYAMAMVYGLSTVPAWDTPVTPVTFFLTAGLPGSLGMGAAFVANFWYVRRQNMDPKNVQYSMLATALRWIALIVIALLGLELRFIAHLCDLALGAVDRGQPQFIDAALSEIQNFLNQHLLKWAPECLNLVIENARTDYYRGCAHLALGCLAYTTEVTQVAMA
jgi:anaerobic dimethyl sulfoxide reductase subunit C (anchor subunit)